MKIISVIVFALLLIGIIGVANVSFAVSLTATPNPFSLSNHTIDVGQISIANTVVSGGTGPYSGSYSFIPSNSAGNNVVNTINVGSDPMGVAFSPSGALAYVTNYGSGTVSVINTATNTTTNTITVGKNPRGVAFSPSGALAYVTNGGSDNINVIDTATNTVTNTIAVDIAPYDVAFSPSGTLAYVTNAGSSSVSVINTATNTITNTINVGSDPIGVAFSPSGAFAYVTNSYDGTVSVINTATNTITNTINVGSDPMGVAFSPSGALAYVTNAGSSSVSVINTATNTVTNIVDNSGPEGVAFSPSGALAYVTNAGSDTVSVINTATNTVTNITVGTGPEDVAFGPSGDIAYVTNYNNGNVSVIDPAETPIRSLPSNNALTMSINAISGNTIALTFNGVESQFNTGSNSIYGEWTFYGYAQDNTTGLAGITGLTGTNTVTSSNTLTIDPAPTATLLTPSNTVLDPGQSETYTVSISGGAPTFTANLIYVSGPTGATVDGLGTGSVIESLTNQQDGIVSFSSFNSFSEVGLYTFNVIATDSASTPVTFNSISNTITVNHALTATSLTPSNTTINSGQYVTYNVIISGGTLPITANLVLVSNSTPIQINGAKAISGTTYNTIVLRTGSTEPDTITFNSLELNTSSTSGGNVIFTVNAVDSASTPVTFNSVASTIIINAVQHNSGGGTMPSKYVFTLSDNINSTLASTQPVYTVYTSSGNTSYYQNQLPLTLSLSVPYINFTLACNVSIGSSKYTYQNDVYGLGLGVPCGRYYNTYTPSLESIYTLSTPTKVTTTTNTTTTTPTTTTLYGNRSIDVNGTISSTLPASINFTNMRVIALLTTTSTTPVRVSTHLTNETPTSLPQLANYTLISALNLSVSATANVSIRVTLPYPCGENSSLIKPFELLNGTWTPITPFYINTTSCTISLLVPNDPILGIFQKAAPATTTITTINTLSTIPPSSVPPPHSMPTTPIIGIIIVIIIVAGIAVYYYGRRGSRRG